MNHHSHHQLSGNNWVDWIPVLLICMGGLYYLFSYVYLISKGYKWRIWQVLSFLSGIVLLIVALLPSMMHWGHSDMRRHMVQHLLIAMYAPIFLVIGAPITLTLKVLPTKFSRSFFSIVKTRFFWFAAHPMTAFFLNIGGMYLLYLTPLYSESFKYPVLHYIIHMHFLASGYLFTWSIIGPDPAPNRPGFFIRLTMLFFSIWAHGFLSKLMYAYLLPENSPHNNFQIQEGAKLMYYWGDLSEIILAIILFLFWYYNKDRAEQNITLLKAPKIGV